MSVDFKRTLDAFTEPLSYELDAPGQIQGLPPTVFFRQFNTFQTRFRTGIYSAITLLADSFMVCHDNYPSSNASDILCRYIVYTLSGATTGTLQRPLSSYSWPAVVSQSGTI